MLPGIPEKNSAPNKPAFAISRENLLQLTPLSALTIKCFSFSLFIFLFSKNSIVFNFPTVLITIPLNPLSRINTLLPKPSHKKLLEKRNKTQPVQYANAGSVFKNPQGDFAARLIESCGLKNHQIGNAQISDKHANFIINTGNATAEDIECLIIMAQQQVIKNYSITLEPEVKIYGER